MPDVTFSLLQSEELNKPGRILVTPLPRVEIHPPRPTIIYAPTASPNNVVDNYDSISNEVSIVILVCY